MQEFSSIKKIIKKTDACYDFLKKELKKIIINIIRKISGKNAIDKIKNLIRNPRVLKNYFTITKNSVVPDNRFKIIIIDLVVIMPVLLFLFTPFSDLFRGSQYSTVLTDRNNTLLNACVADDDQWRFPARTDIPEKLKKCIILFEDKNFYIHRGVDILAVLRACCQNIKGKKIVSGGSTISMQVIRLARNNKRRILSEKVIEALFAVKMEFHYSKKKILSLYSAHAPYGSNIVGVEAASWFYFSRPPENLSWAECSLLAVLPNNPSMIFPGKNSTELKIKRDRLLSRLYEKNIISKGDYLSAVDEPLPEKPYPLPSLASHLLTRAINDGYKGKILTTTINPDIQNLSARIVNNNSKKLSRSNINDACAIVLSIDSGEVLAYIGNSSNTGNLDSKSVDIINSLRSPGSLLKPFLYAFMIDEGIILPNELVSDIPIFYEGFAPMNYNRTFEGAVPASTALIRSLNVPFVFLLREYGYRKFYRRLEQLGMTLENSPDFYSLALILGGAEVTLWDISSMYASMARALNTYNRRGGVKAYTDEDYFKSRYLVEKNNGGRHSKKYKNNGLLDASSLWITFRAMKELIRPEEEMNWKMFESSKTVAWKTGTSFGNRDGWAIGFDSKYLVGVWVGNADGEGRPEIKGVKVAAPILFDIFGSLNGTRWFEKPYSDFKTVKTCRESGMLASTTCKNTTTEEVPAKSNAKNYCIYHRIIHLDENEQYQVDSSCYPVGKMKHKVYFILPPVEEWYYKRKNNAYKTLPPSKIGNEAKMAFIYPSVKSKIYIPIELDETQGKAVFEIAHRHPEKKIYWHLDDNYLGMTKNIHQMGFYVEKGHHEIVAIDEDGNELSESFEVISRGYKRNLVK